MAVGLALTPRYHLVVLSLDWNLGTVYSTESSTTLSQRNTHRTPGRAGPVVEHKESGLHIDRRGMEILRIRGHRSVSTMLCVWIAGNEDEKSAWNKGRGEMMEYGRLEKRGRSLLKRTHGFCSEVLSHIDTVDN